MSLPSVMAVTGPVHLRRRRFLDALVESKRREGWRTDRISGTSPGALDRVLYGLGATFMDAKTVVVVDDPGQADIQAIQTHAKETDPEVVLVLHSDSTVRGNTKLGKFLKTLGKFHKYFPPPERFKEVEGAVAFVVEEARHYSKTIDPEVAHVLVSRVGHDLGVLAFEVQKAVIYMGDEESEIGGRTIGLVMAPLAEAQVFPVAAAVGSRNLKQLSRVLVRVKRTALKDPLKAVCGVVRAEAIKWLAAADLHEKGVDPREAAVRMQQNEWYWQNKVLPVAKGWTTTELTRLLRALALSERALLSGQVDPWAGLCARLLLATRRGG